MFSVVFIRDIYSKGNVPTIGQMRTTFSTTSTWLCSNTLTEYVFPKYPKLLQHSLDHIFVFKTNKTSLKYIAEECLTSVISMLF